MQRLLWIFLILCSLVYAHDPIDVIIPCTHKDLPTLDLCIDAIKMHGRDVRRVIVISKEKLTDKAEWFDEKEYPFSLTDIGHTIFPNNPQTASDFSRGGWILQQLLKLYAPFVIPDISSNVLCLDADVIFFKPVEFINESNTALYAISKEFHLPYFIHMVKLLPSLSRAFINYSGICHHMLFQREILSELFAEIRAAHPGKKVWEAICSVIDPREIDGSCLSEYEIYFNYIFSRDKNVKLRPLMWTNAIGPSPEILRAHSQIGFDFVAYHEHMR